jgi:predicted Zn-dependent protease with MMP-like domain
MNNNAKTWTDDFSTLVEKYAEFVMDSMDMKTMEQFVFDTLVSNFNEYSEEELITEIREYYDDEVLESFGVKITETPDLN